MCRDLTRPRLDALAQRLDVKASWGDLVVPAEQEGLLRTIAAQVREGGITSMTTGDFQRK